ncbi:amino acid transporter [Paenibacillaceae bacterium]|nr:amino acid transporter [Paenibacillaceae bacterium]
MLEVILHGLLLGFGLILPLGAQNMFVFNQGASQPTYVKALPVVITAILCDTALILMAVLGVSLVVLTFSWLQTLLYGLGMLFLLYMGILFWRNQPGKGEARQAGIAGKQIWFALSVSLMNPHAIMDTIGVIGINSLNYAAEERWVFTISIIAVSAVWFFGLAFAGRQVGKRDVQGRLTGRLNKVSALIMWGLAIYMGSQLL